MVVIRRGMEFKVFENDYNYSTYHEIREVSEQSNNLIYRVIQVVECVEFATWLRVYP